MNELRVYLDHYYLTVEQLASICSISVDEMNGLVADGLIPKPSYVVTENHTLISQAFGEFSAHGIPPAQYFHPGNAIWVDMAIGIKERSGAREAAVVLKHRFKENFAAALEELDKTVWRLADSFSEDGKIIHDGIQARTEDAWDAFINGIFSLCVADPTSERSIAKKEILQEALTELSENGSKLTFTPAEEQRIRHLIDQYAEAAMPFSPVEYPTSSRKRLVEDLNTLISV